MLSVDNLSWNCCLIARPLGARHMARTRVALVMVDWLEKGAIACELRLSLL